MQDSDNKTEDSSTKMSLLKKFSKGGKDDGDSGYNYQMLDRASLNTVSEEDKQLKESQIRQTERDVLEAKLRKASTQRPLARIFTSNQWDPEVDKKKYKSNEISTAKYNIVTFLPKNLYEQFKKLANVYFILIAAMQCVPAISISDGKPTILVPLLFVLTVSAIKDAFEDMKRHRSDKEENQRKTQVGTNGGFRDTKWKAIKVGDIVKIHEDEYFPADLILLNSSDPNGLCYVETKNLDGETNLKHKKAVGDIRDRCNSELATADLQIRMSCENPAPGLYEFSGSFTLNGRSVGVSIDQLLLRGSSLRNTGYIYGLVVYTGHESKIMLNSPSARAKQSKIEIGMNKEIIYIFILQMILCTIAGLFYSIKTIVTKDQTEVYLDWKGDETNWFVLFFTNMGTWILIFTNFVPISLIVTLEVVKFTQAIFIVWDEQLYCEETDIPAKVQSSNLNEELGQIHYIFSDKTGTLTCNEMEFKCMSIHGLSYGKVENSQDKTKGGTASLGGYNMGGIKNTDGAQTRKSARDLGITNVDFEDEKFFEELQSNSGDEIEHILNALEHLALCHTILVEEKNGELTYQASSPDELALANYARYVGAQFEGTDANGIMTVIFMGERRQWELLNVLEFNSTRKRMSVIVRDCVSGKIKLLCKGADSIIEERLAEKKGRILSQTKKSLSDYAKIGLRTLLLAEKTLSVEEYEAWNATYQEAYNDVLNRAVRIDEVSENIEKNLELVGATAIEDKLQDQVGPTIKSLKDAGIKVWVLTGDKIETAINIGYSCELLTTELYQVVVDVTGEGRVEAELQRCRKELEARSTGALIISGASLTYALRETLRPLLLEVGDLCSVVLACRVSPKQKAEVVQLVREGKTNITTLSVGDGANDVNMITEAHIGIGIAGKEGQQAVRASDYAIGQFSFLRRLLFVHGREAYRRNSVLVCYNFYKNVLFVMPQFWFGCVSFFSGQPLYDPWIYQMYNIFYTSLPIVLYAIFDRQVANLDVLEQNPQLYKDGMTGRLFNTKVFWTWVSYACVQAAYIAIITFGFMESTGFQDTGRLAGLWTSGTVAYAAVVIVANWKLAHFSWAHYWFSVTAIFLSILLFFISIVIITNIKFTNLYCDLSLIMANPLTWMSFILILGLSVVFDMGLFREQIPKVGLKGERPDHEDEMGDSLESGFLPSIFSGYKKASSWDHTGYAFSAEMGHTPQLISRARGATYYAQSVVESRGSLSTRFGIDEKDAQRKSHEYEDTKIEEVKEENDRNLLD